MGVFDALLIRKSAMSVISCVGRARWAKSFKAVVLSKAHANVTRIVDSQPVAGAQIGTYFVAKAVPDGYTPGVVDNSVVITPALVGDALPHFFC